MTSFYLHVLNRLLNDGFIRKDMRVLVVCGEPFDREVFLAAGFDQVVISNVDDRHEQSDLAPYDWSYQQAETLSYEDNAFDVVVVHLGLHHCHQPHRALCEMYRVARHGILMIEPCENPLVRWGRFLGVGQEYEVHAVAAHGLAYGGAGNGPVPNLVYRWTEREVVDTLRAFAPAYLPRHRAWYHTVIHWHDLKAKRNKGPLLIALLAWPFLQLQRWIAPRLSNNLAVFVEKPGAVHPWLERNDAGEIGPNQAWFEQHVRIERGG